MNDTMKSILSRVLSNEIKQQRIWQQNEFNHGYGGLTDRTAIINEIKQFMDENGIKQYIEY